MFLEEIEVRHGPSRKRWSDQRSTILMEGAIGGIDAVVEKRDGYTLA